MIAGKKNVLRLDVAMHYSFGMCVAQRFADVANYASRFLRRHLSRANEMCPQVLARDERHCVVEQRSFGARSEEWNDMRVLQARSELYLAPKSLEVQSGRKFRREELDDDLAVELELCRDENARHARASKLAVDAIAGS